MREIAKITTSCNQEGGKALTAVSLGTGIVRMGKRVLLVDGLSSCQSRLV